MSEKTDIWLPLYVGDYLASTQHLNAMLSGAYLHLLMHEWKEGPLPLNADLLCRISKVDRENWADAWVVLGHFFELTEHGYVQKRLEAERVLAEERRERKSRHGKAGASARWKDKGETMPEQSPGITQAFPGQWPSSSPSPLKQKTAVPASRGALLTTIPLKDGVYEVREDDLARDRQNYPGMDHLPEYRSMTAWAQANPSGRKTSRGVHKFINSWFQRATERQVTHPRGGSMLPSQIIYSDPAVQNAR